MMNPLLLDTTPPSASSNASWNGTGQTPAQKPSRAAEYIAALYLALLLCTPWLVRDALVLTPPSNGVEIQMSKRASASAEVKADVPTQPAR
jgi:hypothetical protein